MTYVKICGITNVDDARCVASAGVDFLGFIFYPKSPRYVTNEQAGHIVRAIRSEFSEGTPRFVGVFVDEPIEGVQTILEQAELDLAQLHGNESPDELRLLSPRAFKALRPRTHNDVETAAAAYGQVVPNADDLPQFLVDAYHPGQFGGTGMRANLEIARWLAGRFRVVLAGGLTPETVVSTIEAVQPWGVDVSSGVEASKGVKDHARIRTFVEVVRGHG